MAARDPERPEMGISNETIGKMAKEIVVKFIEAGKLAPSGFDDLFPKIYDTIERTIRRP